MKTLTLPIRFPFSRPLSTPTATSAQPAPHVLDPSEQRALALAHALVLQSDDAIATMDADGMITSWNAAATRIFGYTEKYILGRSIYEIVPTRLHMEERSILCRLNVGEPIEQRETILIAADGREILLRMSASPLRNSAGKITGASTIARDITDQDSGERARTHLAAIIDSSEDAIASKNLNGIITGWNAAAEEMFGYRAIDIIGKSVYTIIPKSHHGEGPGILADIIAGKRIERYETVRQHRNSTLIPVSLTVVPVRNEKGHVTGAAKILRNLSQQRFLGSSLLQARKVATGTRSIVRSADEVVNPLSELAKLVEVAKNRATQWDEVRALMLNAETELDRLSKLMNETVASARQTALDAQISISQLSEAIAVR
ncbi:PAS domain S-box-containing protein [Bryocella elongata]|uniref:histidine kinase n=1 Tax=Bryocella elongata TaxID=863522 RepID=A0A1H6C7P6_9BACT|nr:PAS domain S-box protein [Bryocella elongata]SEG68645.1 PAS domain S-box-containing protein [Bryocella elongata]